jgi:hypothetical protein
MQHSLVGVHHLVDNISHIAGVGCRFVCHHGTPNYMVWHLRIWLIKTDRRHFQTHVRWLSWLGLSLPIQWLWKTVISFFFHGLTSSCTISLFFNLVLSYVWNSVVVIGYVPCNLLCNHFLESLSCQSRDNSITLKEKAAHYFRTSVLACNTVHCLSPEDVSSFVFCCF